MTRQHPRSTLFPYPTLFRSTAAPRSPSRRELASGGGRRGPSTTGRDGRQGVGDRGDDRLAERDQDGQHQRRRHHRRSEEHTSELQSRQYLVCRLLLEKKNKI